MSGYHNSSRLVVAANDGNLREVTILLAIGNPLTSEKTRALRQACVPYTRVTVPVWRMPVLRQGQHLAIVRELLRRGAVLDQLQRGTGTRRYDSAFLYDLLRTSTPSIVRVLRANGLDFNTRDRDGKSISEEALKPSNWAHNVNSSMTNRRLLETWGEMSDLVAGNRGTSSGNRGTRGTSGGSRTLGNSRRSRNGSQWEQAPSYQARLPRNAGAAVQMYSNASGVPLGSRVVSGNYTNAAMGMRTNELNNTANSSSARAPPNALYVQGDPTRSLFTFASLQRLAHHPLTRQPILPGSVRRARRAPVTPVTPVTSRTARTAPKRKRNSK